MSTLAACCHSTCIAVAAGRVVGQVYIDLHTKMCAVSVLMWLRLQQALRPGASSAAGVIRTVRCAAYKASAGQIPAVKNWTIQDIRAAQDGYINIGKRKWPAPCDPNDLLLLCLFLTTSENPWQTIGALLLTAKFSEGKGVQVASFRSCLDLMMMFPQLPTRMKHKKAFADLYLDLAMFQQESSHTAFQHMHPHPSRMFFGLLYLRDERQLTLRQMAPNAHVNGFRLKAYMGELQVGACHEFCPCWECTVGHPGEFTVPDHSVSPMAMADAGIICLCQQRRFLRHCAQPLQEFTMLIGH
jgi:hypothetical protein